jgi:hypothetical protein
MIGASGRFARFTTPIFWLLTVRLWPKADPENSSFAVVKASALEKSGY